MRGRDLDTLALKLSRSQFEQMLAQARSEAPNECCGVLLGLDDTVEEIVPGRNIDEEPQRRYLMDPRDELRAFRLMDERGWGLVGIYHSHPATEAYPSETDKRRAHDEENRPLFPGTRYIIVSLREPHRPEVRAFRFDGARGADVVPEDVVVT